jgi:nucleotidyltransferase/DNA polymerase involved in DNA repair
VLLPGDYEKYERFSRWMFSYAHDFTPLVEVSSIDEGYADLTGARRPAHEIAATLRTAIQQTLKISVSEGLAGNKLASQVASKLRKPSSLIHILPGQERAFLAPLPNLWLPGVGPRTAGILDAAGLSTIDQVSQTPADLLSMLVGGGAEQLRRFAEGIDPRPVTPERDEAKSYSHQETFDQDQTDEAYLDAVLRRMADRLMADVRGDGKRVRTLTVKVRYNDFDEDQRSESLAEPTCLETDVYARLGPMLRTAWRRRVSLRLVSLKFSNLYPGGHAPELPLYPQTRPYEARLQLAEAVQELRQTRGPRALMRGHDLLLEGVRAPVRRSAVRAPPRVRAITRPVAFVPLHAHTHYSFLDSLLSPRDLVERAAAFGLPAVAVTDRGNLHGAVKVWREAKRAGMKALIGAELRVDGRTLLLYAEHAAGYANLCRLLTATAGEIKAARLPAHDWTGLVAVGADAAWAPFFARGAYYLGAASGKSAERLRAGGGGLPVVAAPGLHCARAEDGKMLGILRAMRTLTRADQPHPEKPAGDFHFRSPEQMLDLFSGDRNPLERTREIAERCAFSFETGRLHFPAFAPPDGSTPGDFLAGLVAEGARRRYPDGGDGVAAQVREELSIIRAVGYEEYFLSVWDLLREARGRGIPWITRGSAADSLVCYCLGISDVCPRRFDLYFRRFLNVERMKMHKLPDIDVDFPHDRRDEVAEMLLERHGAGARGGGGRVFDLPVAQRLRGDREDPGGVGVPDPPHLHAHAAGAGARRGGVRGGVAGAGVDAARRGAVRDRAGDGGAAGRGFRATPSCIRAASWSRACPLCHLTPLFRSGKGLPATHLDMDDAEDLGLVKLDLLAQGGLAVMRDTLGNDEGRMTNVELAIGDWRSAIPLRSGVMDDLAPWDDPDVWDLVSSGQSRGVHHIESPAMISLARMLNARDIDTLVAMVSVIRPGAGQRGQEAPVRPAPPGHGAGDLPAPVAGGGAARDLRADRVRGADPANLRGLRGARPRPRRPPAPRAGQARLGDGDDHRRGVRGAGAGGRAVRRRDQGGVGADLRVQRLRLLQGAQRGVRGRGLPGGVAEAQPAGRLPRGGAHARQGVLPSAVYALEALRMGIGFRRPCVNDPRPRVRRARGRDPRAGGAREGPGDVDGGAAAGGARPAGVRGRAGLRRARAPRGGRGGGAAQRRRAGRVRAVARAALLGGAGGVAIAPRRGPAGRTVRQPAAGGAADRAPGPAAAGMGVGPARLSRHRPSARPASRDPLGHLLPGRAAARARGRARGLLRTGGRGPHRAPDRRRGDEVHDPGRPPRA